MTPEHSYQDCARNHSVSPHQCYSHEDMAHAEAQAFQEGYLCALWDTAAGQELHLTGVTL